MEFPIHAATGLVLALTFVAHTAGAEPASTAPSNSPIAAPTAYRSAFENYRPFRDEPMVSWQETNHALGALSGHMGHVRGSTGMGSTTKKPDAGATTQSGEKPPMTVEPAERTPVGHAGHGGVAPGPRPQ
jgi:hypothetical protein